MINKLDVDRESIHTQASSFGDIYSTDKPMDEKGWKDERQAWDIFKMTNAEMRFQESHAMMKCIQQLLLLVAYAVSFVLVFGASLISFATFIFMTSNIKMYNKIGSTGSNGILKVSNNWTSMREASPSNKSIHRMVLPRFYEEQLCYNTNITRLPLEWFAEPGPRWLWTFLAETSHTIAIGIFVFSVLPNIDAVVCCMLGPSICLIPALLQPLSRPTGCKYYVIKILLDIVALCGQISAIVYWIIKSSNPHYKLYGKNDQWMITLALCLISFLWWDNYIEKTISIPFLSKLSRYKDTLRRTRPAIHLILSCWNILLYFAIMIMFSTNYYSLKDMFDFKSIFWYEAELLTPEIKDFPADNIIDEQLNGITSDMTTNIITVATKTISTTLKGITEHPASISTLSSISTTLKNIVKRDENLVLNRNIRETLSPINWDDSNIPDTGKNVHLIRYKDYLLALVIQTCSSLLLYFVSIFSCKTVLQKFSFAFPILASGPILVYLMMFLTEMRINDPCFLASVIPSHLFWNVVEYNPNAKLTTVLNAFQNKNSILKYENTRADSMGVTGYLWMVWMLSMCWITSHIWYPKGDRLEQTNKLFTQPMYCPVFTAISLLLSRARETTEGEAKNHIHIEDSINDLDSNPSETDQATPNSNVIPRIYFCATMWHENLTEITQLMKSICRMDIDQNNRRMRRNYMKVEDSDYYEFEANILFDDSMVTTIESSIPSILKEGSFNLTNDTLRISVKEEKITVVRTNQFVKLLFRAMKDASECTYDTSVTLNPPMKVLTPYGGRLVWKLPGRNKIVVHLKNKKLIRPKKRWSQVMYMYYLLGYRHNKRISKCGADIALGKEVADNTFILALDGDVDFQPISVIRLVDLMKKNVNVASACGRIHPAGTGPLVWYQKFEYALGHWLQKAAEHMIGCVLCSPGCFSLFRGSALMADNVARVYTKMAEEPWQIVQYDQGEDRWLCTLILQQGYRIEYSAASDAVTYSPEGFDEFFNQRRRWIPSTMANILDLLRTYRKTVAVNETITFSYILYQAMMFVSTMIGPAVIILLLVGSMSATFYLTLWGSIALNVIPIIIFVVMCFKTTIKHQLLFAKILAGVYGIAMLSFCIRAMIQIHDEGIQSPAAIFIIILVSVIFAASILHPEEFKNVIYGLLYLLVVPTMYLVLIIYSLCNLHIVSWGTREIVKVQLEKTDQKKKNWIKILWEDFISLKEYIPCIDDKASALAKAKDKRAVSKSNLSVENRPATQTLLKDPTNLSNDHTKSLTKADSQIFPEIKVIPVNTSEYPSLLGQELNKTVNQTVIPTINIQKDDSKDNKNTKESHNWWNSNWMEDPELPLGPIGALTGDEIRFWEELLKKYLLPIELSEEKKKEIADGLIQLRNKSAFGFLLANLIFIIVILMLQMNKESLHVKWYISGSKKYLKLEPLSLALLAFFVIILGIQFIAMLFHRWNTLLHILASTELFCFKSNEKEIPLEIHSPEALRKHNSARFNFAHKNTGENASLNKEANNKLQVPSPKQISSLFHHSFSNDDINGKATLNTKTDKKNRKKIGGVIDGKVNNNSLLLNTKPVDLPKNNKNIHNSSNLTDLSLNSVVSTDPFKNKGNLRSEITSTPLKSEPVSSNMPSYSKVKKNGPREQPKLEERIDDQSIVSVGSKDESEEMDVSDILDDDIIYSDIPPVNENAVSESSKINDELDVSQNRGDTLMSDLDKVMVRNFERNEESNVQIPRNANSKNV
ncbi:chitin synthase chs-2-like [Gordionus sp. m RMFG-2023]|uniref:chitin synthase chs-2-like n=1 Tax=Gordionus sp. m RMFG-2023 TaxID=3053472 RepID=UPI0031FBE87A